MLIEKIEDIKVWQKAKELSVLIYKILKDINDYSFKNQIQRASVSIMNNIAEGFERKSKKELSHFLYIAKGSAGEVRSMLALAKELLYINEREFESLNEMTFNNN